MRSWRAGVALILAMESACIHNGPQAGIRAALAPNLPRESATDASGARCGPASVHVVQVVGNEAIASVRRDCGSGSAAMRYTDDYLLVRHGQKWMVVKRLSGGATIAG